MIGTALGAALAPVATAKAVAASPKKRANTLDPVYRLLKRCTFGFDRDEYLAAVNLGFTTWRDDQLDWDNISLPAGWDPATWYSTYLNSPEQNYALISGGPGLASPPVELQSLTMARAVYSPQLLYEVMVERWSDHLNVNLNENNHCRALKPVSDRRVMRPKIAGGDFKVLLKANAHDSAMLEYLDNAISKCPVPNENYARELLELHTMGVDSGYTEDDILALAEILTGWSYKRGTTAIDFGAFTFKNGLHCSGTKTFFGIDYPNATYSAGKPEGDGALEWILDQDVTKTFITTKMAKWFLKEDVSALGGPGGIIDVASGFYPNFKLMAASLLTEANFDAACVDDSPKFMRPFHFAAACFRALKGQTDLLTQGDTAGVDNLSRLVKLNMAHETHSAGPPTGWPDVAAYWGPQQKARWDFVLALVFNQITGVTIDADAAFAQVGTYSSGQAAQMVNDVLCMGHMDPVTEVAPIQNFVNGYTGLLEREKRYALALGLLSPTFSQI